MKSKVTTQNWDRLNKFLESQQPIQTLHQKPISIIIPTFNSSETIGLTIEKALSQNYNYLEIIVIDANSKDRTQEVVLGFQSPKVKLYTVGRFNEYEMLNRGISLARGEYVNFLFPGDYYRADHVLSYICHLAWENDSPELIYCGSILRYPKDPPSFYLNALSASFLKKGLQPTTLPSCWFKLTTLKHLGKFDTKYKARSALDLFCKFYFKHHGTAVRTTRIFLDRDKQQMPEKIILRRLADTSKIIYKYQGIIGICNWIIHDREWPKLFMCWFLKIKTAFSR